MLGRCLGFLFRDDRLERALDLADRLGHHLGVKRGFIEFGMTQKNLDHADIGAALQEVGSEAMAKRVG